MERIVVAVVLAVVAAVVAAVIDRRRRRAPVDSPSWTVPAQLDRADFDRPEAPWLVVVFTSATCETCAAVWERADRKSTRLNSSHVALSRMPSSA